MSQFRIIEPTTVTDLDHVRALVCAFVSWHRHRHEQDIELIDAYFDASAFEHELATLPGNYSRPHGRLLLAFSDHQPAGCVALKRIDATSCEMKRMFVYPGFHGKGIGIKLSEQLINEATLAGYQTMRLDTSIRQREAQSLYEKMGFRRIEPYYELPQQLKEWLVFMELNLNKP